MGQSTQSARTPPLQYFFFPDPRELSYEVLEVLELHHAHLTRFPDRHSLPLHSIIRAVWGCLQRVVERGLRSRAAHPSKTFCLGKAPQSAIHCSTYPPAQLRLCNVSGGYWKALVPATATILHVFHYKTLQYVGLLLWFGEMGIKPGPRVLSFALSLLDSVRRGRGKEFWTLSSSAIACCRVD